MADCTMKTVVDSVVAALKATKAGTVYEPGTNVVAVDDWPDSTVAAGITADTYYVVVVDPETPERRLFVDSNSLTGKLPLEVWAHHRVGAAATLQQATPRWQVASELGVDVEQKLVAAENTKAAPIVAYIDPGVEVQVDSAYVEQWVMTRFRFTVRYRKDRATR